MNGYESIRDQQPLSTLSFDNHIGSAHFNGRIAPKTNMARVSKCRTPPSGHDEITTPASRSSSSRPTWEQMTKGFRIKACRRRNVRSPIDGKMHGKCIWIIIMFL